MVVKNSKTEMQLWRKFDEVSEALKLVRGSMELGVAARLDTTSKD